MNSFNNYGESASQPVMHPMFNYGLMFPQGGSGQLPTNHTGPSPSHVIPNFGPPQAQCSSNFVPLQSWSNAVESLRQEMGCLTDKYKELEEKYSAQAKEIVSLKTKVETLNLALFKQVFVDREEGQITFDSSKIRNKCLVKVDYYDGPSKNIDLVELIYNCNGCKEGITSKTQIAELYRDMLFEIYGEKNIHYYSAAKSNEYTSIPKAVVNGIKSLIFDGYGLDSSGKSDNVNESIKRTEVMMAIQQTNKNLFTNRRQSLKKNKRKAGCDDEEVTETPAKKNRGNARGSKQSGAQKDTVTKKKNFNQPTRKNRQVLKSVDDNDGDQTERNNNDVDSEVDSSNDEDEPVPAIANDSVESDS